MNMDHVPLGRKTCWNCGTVSFDSSVTCRTCGVPSWWEDRPASSSPQVALPDSLDIPIAKPYRQLVFMKWYSACIAGGSLFFAIAFIADGMATHAPRNDNLWLVVLGLSLLVPIAAVLAYSIANRRLRMPFSMSLLIQYRNPLQLFLTPKINGVEVPARLRHYAFDRVTNMILIGHHMDSQKLYCKRGDGRSFILRLPLDTSDPRDGNTIKKLVANFVIQRIPSIRARVRGQFDVSRTELSNLTGR